MRASASSWLSTRIKCFGEGASGDGVTRAKTPEAISRAERSKRHRRIQMYTTERSPCVCDEEKPPREEDVDRLVVVSGVLRRVNVRPSPLRHGSTRILRTNTGRARAVCFGSPGVTP